LKNSLKVISEGSVDVLGQYSKGFFENLWGRVLDPFFRRMFFKELYFKTHSLNSLL
jgi:hypothetical protein